MKVIQNWEKYVTMENYMAKKKNGRMKWKVSLCAKRFVEFWELSLWNF